MYSALARFLIRIIIHGYNNLTLYPNKKYIITNEYVINLFIYGNLQFQLANISAYTVEAC